MGYTECTGGMDTSHKSTGSISGSYKVYWFYGRVIQSVFCYKVVAVCCEITALLAVIRHKYYFAVSIHHKVLI